MIKLLFNDGFVVPLGFVALLLIKLAKEFSRPVKNKPMIIMLIFALLVVIGFTSLLLGWRSYTY